MVWLKSNWRWLVLNLGGVSSLTLVLSLGSMDWNSPDTFDSGLESGKWAIRFLLLCLTMTPLQTYFGWRSMINLRKPAGLWAFAFAVVHVLFYLNEARLDWLNLPLPLFIGFGLLGLLILTLLALTSNRWAMRRLKKNWKRLHRLVYLAGSAGAIHAVMAIGASKKVLIHDPQAIYELKIYLAVLVVLLVVRIPLIRRVLKQVLALLHPQRRSELPLIPLPLPNTMPQPGYGCELETPWVDRVATTHPADDYAPLIESEIFSPSRHN